MRKWILPLFFGLLCLPGLAGTVTGTVEVKVPKKVKTAGGSGSGAYEAQAAGSKISEVEHVVISVLDLSTPPGPTKRVEILQENKTFIPYVTAIRTGTTVDFPNRDRIFHSVYSESEAKRFHLPEYAQGESHSVFFDQPGHVELFCEIHSYMNAHILILANEHFTKPNSKGTYSLENLPAGKAKIQAWHPKLGRQIQLVEVPETGVVKVDFKLR